MTYTVIFMMYHLKIRYWNVFKSFLRQHSICSLFTSKGAIWKTFGSKHSKFISNQNVNVSQYWHQVKDIKVLLLWENYCLPLLQTLQGNKLIVATLIFWEHEVKVPDSYVLQHYNINRILGKLWSTKKYHVAEANLMHKQSQLVFLVMFFFLSSAIKIFVAELLFVAHLHMSY